MAYEITFSLALGAGQAGIADLRAQLLDTSGSDVGSAVSTGFTEIDSGNYIWNYASIPDGHTGAVKFYSNAASSVSLAIASINPQELENTDVKTSTISAAAIWAVLTNTLTTTGSIGKLIVDKLSLISGAISTSSATGDIVITRAVTLDGLNISGITVPGSWTKCYFTVKDDIRDDADSESIIQIVVTSGGDAGDGLLYLNAAAGTLANGTLAVGGSDVTVTLHDDATALLNDATNLDYDVKFLIGGTGKSAIGIRGTADIDLTATRTI